MAAVSVSPASGSIIAKVTGVNISATSLTANDDSAYDADLYPASPAVVYYFKCSLAGQDDLISERFSPNGGTHQWPSILFPAAGSWTVGVYADADDSTIASASVTVS